MSKKCKYALDVGIEKYECTANKCECEYKEYDLNKDGSVNVVLCGESEAEDESKTIYLRCLRIGRR